MDIDFERVQEFDECEYVGPMVFEDLDGRKFYAGARVHNITVSIGDIVRVVLEGGYEDETDIDIITHQDEESFAFCQVLAIYDQNENDAENGEGVKFEARWLYEPHELDQKKRKLLESMNELPNELIETDVLDDIPIGSVSDHVLLMSAQAAPTSSTGAPSKSKLKSNISKSSSSSSSSSSHRGVQAETYLGQSQGQQFTCRYMSLEGRSTGFYLYPLPIDLCP